MVCLCDDKLHLIHQLLSHDLQSVAQSVAQCTLINMENIHHVLQTPVVGKGQNVILLYHTANIMISRDEQRYQIN